MKKDRLTRYTYPTELEPGTRNNNNPSGQLYARRHNKAKTRRLVSRPLLYPMKEHFRMPELARQAMCVYLNHSLETATSRSRANVSDHASVRRLERYCGYIRCCIEDEKRNQLDPRGLAVLSLMEIAPPTPSGAPSDHDGFYKAFDVALKCTVNSIAADRNNDHIMSAHWAAIGCFMIESINADWRLIEVQAKIEKERAHVRFSDLFFNEKDKLFNAAVDEVVTCYGEATQVLCEAHRGDPSIGQALQILGRGMDSLETIRAYNTLVQLKTVMLPEVMRSSTKFHSTRAAIFAKLEAANTAIGSAVEVLHKKLLVSDASSLIKSSDCFMERRYRLLYKMLIIDNRAEERAKLLAGCSSVHHMIARADTEHAQQMQLFTAAANAMIYNPSAFDEDLCSKARDAKQRRGFYLRYAEKLKEINELTLTAKHAEVGNMYQLILKILVEAADEAISEFEADAKVRIIKGSVLIVSRLLDAADGVRLQEAAAAFPEQSRLFARSAEFFARAALLTIDSMMESLHSATNNRNINCMWPDEDNLFNLIRTDDFLLGTAPTKAAVAGAIYAQAASIGAGNSGTALKQCVAYEYLASGLAELLVEELNEQRRVRLGRLAQIAYCWHRTATPLMLQQPMNEDRALSTAKLEVLAPQTAAEVYELVLGLEQNEHETCWLGSVEERMIAIARGVEAANFAMTEIQQNVPKKRRSLLETLKAKLAAFYKIYNIGIGTIPSDLAVCEDMLNDDVADTHVLEILHMDIAVLRAMAHGEEKSTKSLLLRAKMSNRKYCLALSMRMSLRGSTCTADERLAYVLNQCVCAYRGAADNMIAHFNPAHMPIYPPPDMAKCDMWEATPFADVKHAIVAAWSEQNVIRFHSLAGWLYNFAADMLSTTAAVGSCSSVEKSSSLVLLIADKFMLYARDFNFIESREMLKLYAQMMECIFCAKERQLGIRGIDMTAMSMGEYLLTTQN